MLLIKYIKFEHFLRARFRVPTQFAPIVAFLLFRTVDVMGGCGGGYSHMLGIRVCEKRQGPGFSDLQRVYVLVPFRVYLFGHNPIQGVHFRPSSSTNF